MNKFSSFHQFFKFPSFHQFSMFKSSESATQSAPGHHNFHILAVSHAPVQMTLIFELAFQFLFRCDETETREKPSRKLLKKNIVKRYNIDNMCVPG